jgi:hypothetical protein
MTSPRASRSRRAVSTVAGGLVAVLGVAAIASTGGGAAGASTTTYTTNASGRFLSGTIAGNSLDVIAGIDGESATNPHGGARVVHQNSLNAELLNGAIKIPLQKGLQLPGLNVLHLGAVAQYAEADPSGEAIGAAGAVANNGGIGVGGTKGVPSDATLDLSGLGNGPLAKVLNVKATVGAISAHAHQAAGADGKQTGQYEIAGLRLELDLPFLAQLLQPVLNTVGPLLDTLSTTINNLGNALGNGAIKVTIPSLSDLLKQAADLSLLNGGVTVDLTSGTIVVDVEKILQAIGLDLNNLPPNTSLVPYIVDALTHSVPKALSDLVNGLVGQINDLVGQIQVTVGGHSVTKVLFNTLIKPLLTTLTNSLPNTLSTVLNKIDISGALAPIFDLLSKILQIIVNAQSTSHGVFTEQSILLTLGSGTGFSIPKPPIKAPVTVPSSKVGALQSDIRALGAQEKADAQSQGGTSSSAPSTGESPNVAAHTRLTARVQARPALVAPHALAAAPVNALVSLALATATVGPSTPVNPTPVSSSAPANVPSTNVPIGVPAGSGTHGENITLPLVLVLLGLVLAGGGAYAYRGRGRFHG